jgi:hypothetical protein
MRVSSFRALLLALAFVLQTIAAGAGVARALPESFQAGVSEHCERQGPDAGDASDAGRHAGRHHCDACYLCGGPPSLFVAGGATEVLSLRAVSTARLLSYSAPLAPVRLGSAAFARGPPARH